MTPSPIIRRVAWREAAGIDAETLLAREWLVTNGLGGYASGTVCGIPTRRFHGLLVAALPPPLGRTMTLHHLGEEVQLPDGSSRALGAEARGAELPAGLGADLLQEFRLEDGLPAWVYEAGNAVIEKRVLLPHRQNTVLVSYRLVGGKAARLRLRPGIHFRGHEAPLNTPRIRPYELSVIEDRYEISGGPGLPTLRLRVAGAATFTPAARSIPEVAYRVEEARGYDARGELWSPGFFEIALAAGTEATLLASTEP